VSFADNRMETSARPRTTMVSTNSVEVLCLLLITWIEAAHAISFFLQSVGLAYSGGTMPSATALFFCHSSMSESLLIFTRDDECLDHLSVHKVAVELIEFLKPEVIARVIRVRRVVWIAPQIPKVLRQHKRPVEFSLHQVRMFRHRSQHLCSCLYVLSQVIDQLITLGR